jgi:pyruvate dehydrogenase E1 component alpha subunit
MIGKFDPLKGERFQVLGDNGQANPEWETKLSGADLQKIYELMATTRAADLKAFKLQRQGRMGTFAPSLGHEACQVGSAFAVQAKDWVFPYFRDLGTYVTLGLPLKYYYLYWMGNEEGMHIPADLNIFSISVPVGSHLPHAVGCAMAMKSKKPAAAAIAYFGDGATSEGDFSEALNFAGAFQTPNVFICHEGSARESPRRRGTDPHRSVHLPDGESHHFRRCHPVPIGRRGQRMGQKGSARAFQTLPEGQELMG